VGRGDLTVDQQSQLDKLAAYLRVNRDSGAFVDVAGDFGTATDWNLAFQQRRAIEVSGYLYRAGVDPTQLSTVSHATKIPNGLPDTAINVVKPLPGRHPVPTRQWPERGAHIKSLLSGERHEHPHRRDAIRGVTASLARWKTSRNIEASCDTPALNRRSGYFVT